MSSNSNGTLDKALEQITRELKSGLKHGYFEYQIIGEIVKENKRKLTIKAGKSHLYYIAEDEV